VDWQVSCVAPGFDQATLEAIFAGQGKDAAKAYCESVKMDAEDGDEGEQAKEACDAALEALQEEAGD
jgi:hypothetical protein